MQNGLDKAGIKFYGTEPNAKVLRLAKFRLPESVKISNLPAEHLSQAEFVKDLNGSYKIALVEGVMTLGVTEPLKAREILEELFRVGFDRIFITGNTPVNLIYEELGPMLERYQYTLERTLYPQNLFNLNSPKVMFVFTKQPLPQAAPVRPSRPSADLSRLS